MALERYAQWLGWDRRPPSVGLHIDDERLTLAVVRPDPVRLVSLGRVELPVGAVEGDRLRLLQPLAVALRRLGGRLRLAPQTSLVVAIEPATPRLVFPGDGARRPICAVAKATFDRSRQVVQKAGFVVGEHDVTPVALSRVAGLHTDATVALAHHGGWTVMIGPGYFDAERIVRPGAAERLAIGSGLADLAPVTELPGLIIPDRLRGVFDPALDSVAVGAALRACGLGPPVGVEPVADPIGDTWSMPTLTKSTQLCPLP